MLSGGIPRASSPISSSRSSLLVRYRYRDMVVKPSRFATADMDTARSPSASAIATAESTIRSKLNSRLGPRCCGWGSTPQARASPRGSSVCSASLSMSYSLFSDYGIDNCVYQTYSLWRIQKKGRDDEHGDRREIGRAHV